MGEPTGMFVVQSAPYTQVGQYQQFQVSYTDGGGTTIQWQRKISADDWVDIPEYDGQIAYYTNSLTSILTMEYIGNYIGKNVYIRAKLTYNGSVYYSPNETGLQIDGPPGITTQPQSATQVEGSTVTLSVVASSFTQLSYQWYKWGSPITDALSDSLTINSTSAANIGDYYVIISNAYGSVTSDSARIIISQASMSSYIPIIQSAPYTSVQQLQTFITSYYEGTTIQWQLKNSADGDEWQDLPEYDGANPTGSLTPALSLKYYGRYIDNNVYIRAKLTYNGNVQYGPHESGLQISGPPSITTQPQPVTQVEGSTVTLSVVASGVAPLYYQWYKWGIVISDASNASFIIVGATTLDSGSYSVVVSNSFGISVYSGSAVVTLTQPPPPNSPPEGSVIINGNSIEGQTLTASNNLTDANGMGSISYQWTADGADILGASGDSLLLTSAHIGKAIAVRASYTDGEGNASSKTSDPTDAVVGLPPTIQTQPQSISKAYGSTFSLSVSATSDAPLSYQWKKAGVSIQGATTNTLIINNATAADNGSYYVVVSNAFDTVTSASAIVSLGNIPIITLEPVGNKYAYGSTPILSVGASGEPTLTYQWYKDGFPIVGATNASITLDSAGLYFVVVINAYGSDTSNFVTILFGYAPTITTQPVPTTVEFGTDASFNVVAAGEAPLEYQWYNSSGPITNATSATLNVTADNIAKARDYYVVVSNGYGPNAQSDAVRLSISPGITTQPMSDNYAYGSTPSLSVGASGEPTLTYQWKLNNVDIENATSALYEFSATAGKAGSYTVVVSNAYGNKTSNPANITLYDSVVDQPDDIIVAYDASATFTGLALEGYVNYKWYKDDGDEAVSEISDNLLQNGSSNSITINNVSQASIGRYYFVATKANDEILASQMASLHMPAYIYAHPVSVDASDNTQVTLSATIYGSDGLQYQWQKSTNGGTSWADIDGKISAILSFENVHAADAASYRVQVRNVYNAGEWVNSNPANVHVFAEVTAEPSGNNIGVANGSSSTTLSITTVGEITSIQWQRAEIDSAVYVDISGAIDAVYNSALPLGKYRAVVNGYRLTNYETPATTVYVLQTPIGPQANQNKYVMAGDSLTLTAPNVLGSGLGYIWHRNPTSMDMYDNIPGSEITLPITVEMLNNIYTAIVYNPYDSRQTTQSFTIVEALKITAQPQDADIPFGSSVQLSVVAQKGDPNAIINYQWYKNAELISGATDATYTATQADIYYVKVGLQGIIIPSSPATLTSVFGVAQWPPSPFAIQWGTTGTIPGPVAGGVEGIQYTWYKGADEVVVQGPSDVSGLTLQNVSNSTAGTYRVEVSVGDQSASQNVILHISAKIIGDIVHPSIIQHVNDNYSIAITASGESFTLQWQKKPIGATEYVDIDGATSSNYSISNLIATNAGVYRVKVIDAYGPTLYSGTQTLRIAPTIIANPQATTVAFNLPTTFTVDAAGEAPLTYQWYGPSGEAVGTNSATLSVLADNIAKAGNYYVRVSNNIPAYVDSAPVRLNISPSVTLAPQVVVFGNTATFTAVANGEGLRYAWSGPAGPIQDASNATLSVLADNLAKAGLYTVSVSGDYAPSVSASASLVIGPAILTNGAPVGGSYFVGESASFSVTASGENLTYQWYRDVSGNTTVVSGVLGGTISDDVQHGSTTSTLSFASVATADAGYYYVKVLGETGTTMAVTQPFRLNVKASVLTYLTNATVKEGSPHTFNVVAQGEEPFLYRWEKDGNVLSEDASSLTITNVGAADAGFYTVYVYNQYQENPILFTAVQRSIVALHVSPRIITPPVAQLVAYGKDASFNVVAAGEAPLTYTWHGPSSSQTVGTNSATLNVTAVDNDKAGMYYVMVSNGWGDNEQSDPVRLSISTSAALSDKIVPFNQSATFTAVAHGEGLTYTWVDPSGDEIEGETGESLTVDADNLAKAGAYRVTVAGTYGTQSATALLVVGPTILTGPIFDANATDYVSSSPSISKSYFVDASASISVTASGENLSYVWYKDVNGNTTVVSGVLGGTITDDVSGLSTTSTLSFASVATANAGVYYVKVLGKTGTTMAVSERFRLNVKASIKIAPIAITKQGNTSHTFTVEAQGEEPYNYQWSKDGINIGTNAPSLTLNNVNASNAGMYSVAVWNQYNNVLHTDAVSTPVRLSVSPGIITPPVTPPVTQTIADGNNVTFTVVAAGENLSYSWKKDGSDVVLNTTASLTLSAVHAANDDHGVYTVSVSGDYAPIVSASATLYISPTFTVQPITQTVTDGSNVTFEVDAVGQGPLSYQWKKNGTPISGAIGKTLTFTNVTIANIGTYTVTVTGVNGTNVTATAYLRLAPKLMMNSLTAPPNNIAAYNSSALFTVTATGEGLTYVWKKDGSSIVLSTLATLNLSSVKNADAGVYTVTVTGAYGNPVSISSSRLNISPTITTAPVLQIALYNNTATFTVDASGEGPLSYQWTKTVGGPIRGDIITTGKNLTIPIVQVADAGTYTVTVTGAHLPTVSASAQLKVGSQILSPDASDVSKFIGETAVFTVSASGEGLTYQWYKDSGSNTTIVTNATTRTGTTSDDTAVTNSGTRITGATTNTLTINTIVIGDAAKYYVMVSGASNTVAYSKPVRLNIKANVLTQPIAITKIENASHTFSVTTQGELTGISYQWYKNGSALSGKTASSLYIANVRVSDAGMYNVAVYNNYNTSRTDASSIPVRLNVAPRITTQPASVFPYVGATSGVSFNIGVSGEGPFTITWVDLFLGEPGRPISSDWVVSNNFSNTSGGTSTITLNRPVVKDDTNIGYRVTIVGAYGTVISDIKYLTIKASVKGHFSYGSTVLGSAAIMSSEPTPYVLQYGIAPTAQPVLTIYSSPSPLSSMTFKYYTGDASGTLTSLSVPNAGSFINLFDTTGVGANIYLYSFTLALSAANVNTLATASANGTKAVYLRAYVSGTWNSGDQTQFSDMKITFAPVITAVTGNMTPIIGSNTSLTYTWNGPTTPLSSTFYKGASPITIDSSKYSSTTNNTSKTTTLTINNIAMSDIANYSIVLSNGQIPTGTSSADITGASRSVHIAPTLGTLSAPTVPLFTGDSWTMTESGVSGEAPFTYTWKNNTSGATVPQSSSSTSNTYTVNVDSTSTYSVMVTNSYGSTLYSSPIIRPNVATLAASATTIGGVKYYGNNVKTGVDSQTIYYDVATGVSSGMLAVALESNPGIASFQWEFAPDTNGTLGSYVSTGAMVGKITSMLSSFTVNATTAGGYRLRITQASGGNYGGTYAGATFYGPIFRFRIIPIITAQPVANVQIVGQTATYSVAATNMKGVVWKKKGTSSDTVLITHPIALTLTQQTYGRYTSTISNANPPVATLTFTVADDDEGTYYACPTNDAALPTANPPSVKTNEVTLSIPASFNVPPVTTAAILGEPFTFTVSSYGKLPVTYTWYKNGQAYQTRTLSSKTDTLTFPSVINEDGANYTLDVSNEHTVNYKANFGGVTQRATFRLKIMPVILSAALKNITAIVGAKIQYSVAAGGSLPLSYQWYKDNSPLSNKTSSELLIASAALGDSGAYKCKVSNVDGDIFSNIPTVSVSNTLGVVAFDTGFMPLGEQKDMTIAGVSYKAMKQPVINNAAEFTMEGKKVIAAAISGNSGVDTMAVNYAQPVFDGTNYRMKFNINVYDKDGTQIHMLPNGASATIVWDLPTAITDLNKPTLTLEHYEDDGVTIKEYITATRRPDGKYVSTHTSFSPADVTTTDIKCFPAGTRILTAAGYKAVEDLCAEDKIMTADGRAVAFNRYTTHVAKTTTNTAPYEIAAGAFGRRSPPVAIRLSPLHAIQSRKGVWQIPTYAARSNAGVKQYAVGESVTYYHVELPNYFTDNIVMEGGAVVESFGSTQTKGLKNVYKYNATLGGFTRISAAATKTVAKK